MLAATAIVMLVACSSSGDSDSTPDTDPSATGVGTPDSTPDFVAVSSTVASESRPVPTVPPSTIAGQSGTTTPGVVNASPTIVAQPPEPVDPDAPATTQSPPTTDLIGDPQPNPNTTLAPPPPTAEPPPSACDRLINFGIETIVTEAGGAAATTENVSESVCRYLSASVVAEVHFVPESDVRNDWYVRSGIEPVGEVSGDAVGLSSFVPPGESPEAGYTIALVGGRQGVIVAVRGTGDARFVAGQVAIFANQAA